MWHAVTARASTRRPSRNRSGSNFKPVRRRCAGSAGQFLGRGQRTALRLAPLTAGRPQIIEGLHALNLISHLVALGLGQIDGPRGSAQIVSPAGSDDLRHAFQGGPLAVCGCPSTSPPMPPPRRCRSPPPAPSELPAAAARTSHWGRILTGQSRASRRQCPPKLLRAAYPRTCVCRIQCGRCRLFRGNR